MKSPGLLKRQNEYNRAPLISQRETSWNESGKTLGLMEAL
jgi:hypothetical protein